MIYKYILFDWDGCLAKTLDIWFFSAKDLLKKHGINPNDVQIVKGFGDWEFAKKLGVKDNDLFNNELINMVNDKLRNIELYRGVIELLRELKAKDIKLALVTTSVKTSVVPALEKYNISNFFDVILTAEDVKKHKPNPEVVLKSIDLLNAKKEETLIIGDGPKDIIAGKAVGITTVSFYPNENKRYYSENDIKSFGADYVINNLPELLNLIDKN